MIDNHLELKDIDPSNYRLISKDKNYSYQKNYAVVKRFLKEQDRLQDPSYIDRKVNDNAGDIADVLASFAKYKLDIGGGKHIEEWLGKERLGRIYGERLVEKLKVMDSVRRLNLSRGNNLYGGNFYIR